MERERVEMMVVIYESGDEFSTQTDTNTNIQQPLQSTGSERLMMRSYRSVTVCLVLLCVLLLTAVIVLCVLINTNNHQWHIKSLTEERDEIIAKYNNISKLMEEGTHFCDRWKAYQSSLYFISSEKKNWTESRKFCRERGADLIIINNTEEQDFIKKITDGGSFWIGLSDSAVEGTWKWVDGSTLTSSFWKTGEPDGGTTENCVESYSSVWNDMSCNNARKWICEKSF